ncbi:MutS-related protein [Erysipelatoclostridium sp. An173]|uniref:MutS family DNA mismatch repair protein n=1 Tax=Erysipelatoclostridium sp. An173 TaxID=1965571 RepID=UPI0032097196
MKLEYFTSQKDNLDKQIKQLESATFKISMLRLLVGLSIIVLLLVSYFYKIDLLVYVCFLLLVIFMGLVYYYNKLNQKLSYLKAKAQVVLRYLQRFNHDWKEFEETGSEFFSEMSGPVKDLDLAGQNSLYQFLNTATSSLGKKRLIDKLTRKSFDYKAIIQEQQAVEELGEKLDFVLETETYGKMTKEYYLGERAVNDFLKLIKDHNSSNKLTFLNYLIPVITIVAILLFCFKIGFQYMIILVPLLIMGQLFFAALMLLKNRNLFDCSAKLSSSLEYYLNVCNLISGSDFNTNHLQIIKTDLQAALLHLRELKKISDMIKQRNNLLAFLLLNGLLLWDRNCYSRLNQWIDDHGNQLEHWLKQIGELESLISLQVLIQTKTGVSMPSIVDEHKPVLEFQDAYHPLLVSNEAVANSFKMERQVAIITGSNMSGKTTFLRTVGINLVLAYAGGPVMAKSFTCSLMQLFTSMRIEDDIEGISTFYGELLRIKEIVEENRTGKVMIALIDEIFKGTNSADRIIGARETVKQLSSNNIFTLITTHDFELCELENDVSCKNYHFEEYYQDDKIKFDYRIKDGRSKTTNAQYLLKMVGIIE